MKRCPLCSRTYEDNALSFCLADGSALINDEPATPSSFPPQPTIPAPPPATDWSSPRAPVTPSPGSWNSAGLPQQPAPAWSGGYQQPVYRPSPEQGLAISSLVCGVLSFVCCSIFTGIPAIVLGIMAINKEKNDPQRYSGKGMAIGGIVMGALSILIASVYVLALLAGVIR
ncbi:MAG TPA: DUF4190 domain-containing protein [Pyrinomonadaceae bacterium]